MGIMAFFRIYIINRNRNDSTHSLDRDGDDTTAVMIATWGFRLPTRTLKQRLTGTVVALLAKRLSIFT